VYCIHVPPPSPGYARPGSSISIPGRNRISDFGFFRMDPKLPFHGNLAQGRGDRHTWRTFPTRGAGTGGYFNAAGIGNLKLRYNNPVDREEAFSLRIHSPRREDMTEHSKEQAVGVVRDYFRKLQVAAVEVTKGTIKIGDNLRFLGHTTDLVQRIESMQANYHDVLEASKGDYVGIEVAERVREGDLVYIESGKPEEQL
jgi:hypothetical protein